MATIHIMQEKGGKRKQMVGEVPNAGESLGLVRLRTKTSQDFNEKAYVTPKRSNFDKGSPGDGNTSSGTKSTSGPASFLDSKL